MNIGIDFDNTIARFDASFREVALAEGFIAETWGSKGKTELRDHLREQPDGEITWMRLQGLVYGKYMPCADLMPGVAGFLLKCKSRNHEVFIVSHKTEFGHFDPAKISLRRESMKWMTEKRFFDPDYFGIEKDNVFFADTREEKVERIAQLECEYFIDDLPEVFAEKKFPRDTKKILYGHFDGISIFNIITPMNCWGDISEHVLGCITDDDVRIWANLLLNHPIKKCEKISGRGNSRVYKLTSMDARQYALKMYPDRSFDGRTRLETEFNAVRFLRANGFDDVPDAVRKDDDLNLGIYSWIDGQSIGAPDHQDLDQAVEFVGRLYKVSKTSQHPADELATEACLSAMELINQIDARFKRLRSVSMNNPALSEFLEQIFSPMWRDLREDLVQTWPESSREKDLDPKYRILSPSDFGFHNALKDGEEITFIDFEYFGWDDPVKLTSDFLWHPAMELHPNLTAKWKNSMLDIFASEPYFKERLNAAMPLYGLRWAMIVLNEFLPGFAGRRKNAGGTDSYNPEQTRKVQLRKAKHYCEKVKAMISQVTYAQKKV
jgi:hypothetical protein